MNSFYLQQFSAVKGNWPKGGWSVYRIAAHRMWKAGLLSDVESGRRLTEHVALFMTEKHATVSR